jgi:hypothetical protein
MRSVSRISYSFAVAALITAAGLIGWVARNTSADNLPRQPVIRAMPPTHEILELAQAPAEPVPAQLVPAQSTPAVTEPSDIPATAAEPPKPDGPQNSKASTPEFQPGTVLSPDDGPSPAPVAAAAPNPSAADNEDPEKAVQSFVDQNQKVAETQLKNLRDEEAKLRARLQKVEAGIKRWEVLVEALKVSKNGSVASPRFRVVPPPSGDTPYELDAIPKSKIGPPPATEKKSSEDS